MSNPFTQKDALADVVAQVMLGEKTLTDAEKKKREEIAQAMERENPGMDMSKKMAIATAQAKKVAKEVDLDESDYKNHFKVQGKYKDKDGNTASVTHRIKYAKDADHAKRLASDGVGKSYQGYKPLRATQTEQAEQEDLETFLEEYTTMFNEAEDTQQLMLLRAMAQDPSDLMKMKRALKAGDKALTNPILRQEILKMLDQMMNLTTTDKSLLQKTRMGFQKAKTMKMPEEVEMHEDDLSVRTLYDKYADRTANAKNTKPVEKAIKKVHGSGVLSNLKKAASANFDTNFSKEKQHFDKARKAAGKTDMIGATVGKNRSAFRKQYEEVQLEAIGAKDKQDEGEYGYEGDMAMSQLRTIIRNCEEMMKVLDKETDLPEWVQSKITLATDYLQTANDYLMSELEEEVELGEADEKEVGKEIKAARLKKDSSDFMSKSSLFSGGARDVAKHLGKKDDEKYGQAMKKVKDTPVSKFVASRKGAGKVRTEEVGSLTPMNPSYRKIPDMVAKDPPFEGGRPVKSTKSAAERVKKIAKGMEKHYNKDKK